ncbi:MAG: hypothetical protein GX258_04210 [Clostridiales bacterium]|nr:hypothetical protein [Clostridiales bacterium]
MAYSIDRDLHDKAKKMLLAGDSYDKVMRETHLRKKDLRRIELNEILPDIK